MTPASSIFGQTTPSTSSIFNQKPNAMFGSTPAQVNPFATQTTQPSAFGGTGAGGIFGNTAKPPVFLEILRALIQ